MLHGDTLTGKENISNKNTVGNQQGLNPNNMDNSVPRDQSYMSTIAGKTKKLLNYDNDNSGNKSTDRTQNRYYESDGYRRSTNEASGRMANENYRSMVDPVISNKDVAESQRKIHEYQHMKRSSVGSNKDSSDIVGLHNTSKDREIAANKNRRGSTGSGGGILRKLSFGGKKPKNTSNSSDYNNNYNYRAVNDTNYYNNDNMEESNVGDFDSNRDPNIKSRAPYKDDYETYNNINNFPVSEQSRKAENLGENKQYKSAEMGNNYRQSYNKEKQGSKLKQNAGKGNQKFVGGYSRNDDEMKMNDSYKIRNDTNKNYSGNEQLGTKNFKNEQFKSRDKGDQFNTRNTENKQYNSKNNNENSFNEYNSDYYDEDHVLDKNESNNGVWTSITSYLGMGSETKDSDHYEARDEDKIDEDFSKMDIDKSDYTKQRANKMPGDFEYDSNAINSVNQTELNNKRNIDYDSNTYNTSTNASASKYKTTQEFEESHNPGNANVGRKAARINPNNTMNSNDNNPGTTMKSMNEKPIKHDVSSDLVTESQPYRMVQNDKDLKHLKSENAEGMKTNKISSKNVNKNNLAYKDNRPVSRSIGAMNENMNPDNRMPYNESQRSGLPGNVEMPSRNVGSNQKNSNMISSYPNKGIPSNQISKKLNSDQGYYAGTHTKSDMPQKEFLPEDYGTHIDYGKQENVKSTGNNGFLSENSKLGNVANKNSNSNYQGTNDYNMMTSKDASGMTGETNIKSPDMRTKVEGYREEAAMDRSYEMSANQEPYNAAKVSTGTNNSDLRQANAYDDNVYDYTNEKNNIAMASHKAESNIADSNMRSNFQTDQNYINMKSNAAYESDARNVSAPMKPSNKAKYLNEDGFETNNDTYGTDNMKNVNHKTGATQGQTYMPDNVNSNEYTYDNTEDPNTYLMGGRNKSNNNDVFERDGKGKVANAGNTHTSKPTNDGHIKSNQNIQENESSGNKFKQLFSNKDKKKNKNVGKRAFNEHGTFYNEGYNYNNQPGSGGYVATGEPNQYNANANYGNNNEMVGGQHHRKKSIIDTIKDAF